MIGYGWILFLVLLLTILGSAALVFITVKYYWGERGTPPLSGEARRQHKEKEMVLRAKQIEYNLANPRKERSPSFWDNRKR